MRTTTLLEGWAQMLLTEIPVAGTPASRAAASSSAAALLDGQVDSSSASSAARFVR